MSIHEMLSTKKESILGFVPDYRMNLIAPSSMDEVEIDKFRSNFRDLATFIRCCNDKDAMNRLAQDERFRHLDPLVANIANDVTSSGLKIEIDEKGEVDMCVAIAGIREDGRAEGRAEGKLENAVATARKMITDRLPLDKIAEYTGLSREKVNELADIKK